MSEAGVESKGGSLHDAFGGFDGFGGSGKQLVPSFRLSYKIQDKEATVTVSAVAAVSVGTATPLKLNPPLRVCNRWFPNSGLDKRGVW